MQSSDLTQQGEHTMTVCNSCRYCEQYCAMFPAMERRLTFTNSDLSYLANLCHNCGECLYACQYAPPHEFGINVPRTMAQLRLASYEAYCWPRALGSAFRQQGVLTALALAGGLTTIMLVGAWLFNPGTLFQANPAGDFYSVMPHHLMVAVFGGVAVFVALAITIGISRFWRDVQSGLSGRIPPTALWRGMRDALTLRHLHATGVDCTTSEEIRTPWRRVFHHCTFYGFMACLASTSVAAIYHSVFGWQAPHSYSSLPVVLGTLGGVGLLVGPAGLMWLRRSRDQMLTDPAQQGLDVSFVVLLFLTSLTGMLLLVLRNTPAMGALLIIHLGVVLALFLALPYGKFMHGFYRTAALVKYGTESDPETD